MRALVRNVSMLGIVISLGACGLDLSVPGARATSSEAGVADAAVSNDARVPADASSSSVPGVPPSSVQVEVKEGSIDKLGPGATSPCSKGGKPVDLNIVNDTSDTIEVVDVTFECRESPDGTIDSGESDSRRTSENHRWRLKSTSGSLLLDFVVAHGPVEIRLR